MEKWEYLKKELDDIFFKPKSSAIRKGSKEYKDFWEFLERYSKFKSKGKQESSKACKSKHDDHKSVLNLPKEYDQHYKVNITLTSKKLDLIYQSLPRESAGKTKRLTKEAFKEFKSIILYYLDFCQKQKLSKLVKLRTDQENLPIRQYKDQIIYAVQTNQVVLVAGDTGCGKSTQVPQYLLSAGFMKIACTQPRRIACMSLSKRVAHETLNEYGSEVAYQVRFESSKSKATRILFLTEGLLLRQFHGDPTLSQYNVIVVDEVHERHLNGDFLLGVLYCLLQQRKDLKLILMSATINITLFAEYFEGAPVIQVPGRLYPIELQYVPHYLEKSEREGKSERLNPSPFLKVMQSIDHKYPSSERGDLLIFMSGMSEIESVVDAGREYAKKSERWIVLPLHSALSIEEQDKVFDISPSGVRKCIVSTNIAETSITIDGVRFIADSGKVKEMRFDSQTKMQRLQELWISQASAEQRKGRAGRTGPGVCYRLYSEEDYSSFAEYSTPEIRRVPLDSLVLQMADFGLRDATKFPFLESPTKSSLENAIYFLKLQNALKDNGELTSLGKMLAKLPVDISVGTLLIMGTLFHVTEPVLIIAAALSVQSPMTRRIGNEFQIDVDQRRQELESEHGDAFFLLNLYDEWTFIKGDKHNSSKKWCRRRGVEEQRFYEMAKLKRQFEQLLKDHNLIQSKKRPHRETYDNKEIRNMERGKLLKLKRNYQNAPRKRKILKLDHSEVDVINSSNESEAGDDDDDDDDDDENKSIDIHDIEFKLTHDLNELQKTRNRHREFSMKDLNILKLILCSGLYPQIAYPDETNPWRKQTEQLFHTKDKQFLLLHPTSIYSMRPALLENENSDENDDAGRSRDKPKTSTKNNDIKISQQNRYLMAYVSLLETNKPYLVNVIKVPAIATLLLFSRSLDTNSDCSRIVCDEWLELTFAEGQEGQEIMSKVIQLRSAWQTMLDTKLSMINDNNEEKDISEKAFRNEYYNRDILSRKLAAFLDAHISYKFRRISASDKDHLYVCSSVDVTTNDAVSFFSNTSKNLIAHPIKGGICMTDYLTFGCLQDSDSMAVASGEAEFLRQHYHCNICGAHLICNVVERLQHDQSCHLKLKKKDHAESPAEITEEFNSSSKAGESYYCELCQKDYTFTAIEILKHKMTHD